MSGSDTVSASYVGSSGHELLCREGTIAGMAVATNHGASGYHALQMQYRRRLAHGLQVNTGYTWSHSIDNGSWDSGLALVQESQGIAAARDRGSSSFDVQHSHVEPFRARKPLPKSCRDPLGDQVFVGHLNREINNLFHQVAAAGLPGA